MVKDYMTDPFEVRIDPKTVVNTNIEHQYAVVHPKDKAEALTRFLDLDPELYGVVFCRTKMDTQKLPSTSSRAATAPTPSTATSARPRAIGS